MRIINTSGQVCPGPLVETKRALKDSDAGESFQVITDSKTSCENISRFLKDNKTEYSIKESAGLWTITVTKITAETILANTEEYSSTHIPHLVKGDFITVFTSDRMGEGDEELGHLLMLNFIKAIKDLEVLPGKMVFYNKGVLLGSEDSPVLRHLSELESMGIMLLFCETCVNFYLLNEKLKVGILSNMFEIAQVMASASNIVKP